MNMNVFLIFQYCNIIANSHDTHVKCTYLLFTFIKLKIINEDLYNFI